MEQPPAKATASGLVQSLVWMPELSQGVAVAQGCLGGCSALVSCSMEASLVPQGSGASSTCDC